MWFESTLIDHDVSLNYGNWNREARVRWAGRRSEPDAETVLEEEHTHLMARITWADKGGEGTYDTAAFIRLWVPELKDADHATLLSRKHPPPVYEILCSSCMELDKSSVRRDGKILCSSCSGLCAWCGSTVKEAFGRGKKRKWYCNQCWEEDYRAMHNIKVDCSDE